MKRLAFLALVVFGASFSPKAPLFAQDRVVTAGQDGVPAPKRTRTVNPVYPQEAMAQGIRGIVILEVLIDPQGKVAAAEIVRSIPGLDEAALDAVRKWEYEITKVDGRPVSVKLTVPITFAMRVPEVTRAPGIPELRQGANIQYPAGQTESASVTAEVTLGPDGQVAEAEVLTGNAPFTVALLNALRTWRFASEGEGVVLSFRAEADFSPPRGDKARVEVRLTSLRRSETGQAAAAPEAAEPAAPTPPAPIPEAPGPTTPAAPASTEAPGPDSAPAATAPPAPAPPTTTPAAPPATAPPALPAATPPQSTPAAPAAPVTPPVSVPPAPTAAPAPASPAPASPGPQGAAPAPEKAGPPTPPALPGAPPRAGAPPAPPVEVLTAPRPPAEAPRPVEPGVSAIKDVTLALGVPDLVRGRRPVPPPLARMAGASGVVEVRFGVDAAGATSVTESRGPDLLTPGAIYTVQSWFFRRVTAERLHLLAVFEYAGETVKTSVRPQE